MFLLYSDTIKSTTADSRNTADGGFDSVATLSLCVFYRIPTLLFCMFVFPPDVCKDNPEFKDGDNGA